MDLGSTQKEKVKQFKAITGTGDDVAVVFLKRLNWNVENAVNAFFESPEAKKAQPKLTQIKALFKTYADPSTGYINIDGLTKFFSDCGITDLMDPVTLVIANYWKPDVLLQIEEEKFVQGMTAMNCASVEELRNNLTRLRKELLSDRLKEIYINSFVVNREKKEAKMLEKEVAIRKVYHLSL
eukprot:TRINITY_DN4355_c0_g1_i5.p1 TRINITY_DN4355_c0_g1~~TRINITY_DN4355_c0_g1_i5.p1  ORF type:complete len:182 (-),score=46.32 TRINITY_DN4355_c0_g1_i5:570-1115(-)